MGKCWLLMLAVAYSPSVLTCNLEYNTKVITNDRHIYFRILIWSTIIIYEQNRDETFWQRKNIGSCCGTSMMLPLSWTVFLNITQKELTLIDTLFWACDRGKTIGHCCGALLMVSLLWLVVTDYIILLIRRVSF